MSYQLIDEIINELSNRDWDFREADTQYLTHGLHPYPARMIPQIPHELIPIFTRKGDTVLDPFCGSGTVLVEAKLYGRNAIGVDINPLACLLAKGKTTPIKPEILDMAWDYLREKINDLIKKYQEKKIDVSLPDIPNLEYWFKEYVAKQLSIIKLGIDSIKDIEKFSIKEREELWTFFAIPFSRTIREVSLTRNGEFKLFRIPKEQIPSFNPDVKETFFKYAEKAISTMKQFYKKANETAEITVYLGDFKEIAKTLPEESIKLMITSPPYGDSRTTVAYGQFSRFSNIWLGYKEIAHEVDKKSLGGKRKSVFKIKEFSKTLDEIAQKLMKKSYGRMLDVLSYFDDFYKCLLALYPLMKRDSIACFVLGNRTVSRIRIPTNIILSELAKEIGFTHLKTLERNIPMKVMPWENAPENLPGLKGPTMAKEYIVILKK